MSSKTNGVEITLSCRGMPSRPKSFLRFLNIPKYGNLPLMPSNMSKLYFSPPPVKTETLFPKNKRISLDPGEGFAVKIFDLNTHKKRHNPQLMQLLWIPLRSEWIAVPSIRYDYGPSGSQEFFRGPYQIDNYCADFLGLSYGIPSDILSTQEIRCRGPRRLEAISAGCQF